MAIIDCPQCGSETAGDAIACPHCGRAAGNGAVPKRETPVPAEARGWTRYETPPDILERARRTFDMEDHLAEVREIERTGGVRFEDFIVEVERQVRPRE